MVARAWETLDYCVSDFVSPSETIIVSGFWRSGTTWLQLVLSDVVGAKTIFEPLAPGVPGRDKLVPGRVVHGSLGDLHLYMPGYSEDLEVHWKNALVGKVGGLWVRRLRNNWREALCRKIVVKEVRGAFSLGHVQRNYGNHIIHLMRDPRAIAASMKNIEWGSKFLMNFDLKKLLLIEAGAPRNWIEQYAPAIRWWNNRDPVVKLVVHWAITQKWFLEHEPLLRDRVHRIRYEEVVENEKRLRDLVQELGESFSGSLLRFNHPNPLTAPNRRTISRQDRLLGWKKILSEKEQELIEEVVSSFEMDIFLLKS